MHPGRCGRFARRSLLAALAAQICASPAADSGRPPAPDFELRDSRGRKRRLSDFKGQVVLLQFWATWCPICRREISLLEQLQSGRGPRGFVVIGVAMDQRGWAAVTPFLAQRRVGYLIVLGNPAVARRYSVSDLPRIVLIDRQGRIASSSNGMPDAAALLGEVDALLAEPGGSR